jgi:adenine-specific DNA-methyltransferase
MGVSISYMGTKKGLAPAVAEVIRQAKPGILLDAFAGMCSVGEEVGPARQIWANDIQIFAAQIATALFTAHDEPISSIAAADLHWDLFEEHRHHLEKRFKPSLVAEDELLESTGFTVFSKRSIRLEKQLKQTLGRVRQRQYTLFTTLYSNSYFGLRQAIEADAIVRAVEITRRTSAINDDHKRWFTIALGRALLRISNSTGHFAQFLKPKESSFKRYLSQRHRSLWSEWLSSVGELQPVGTMDWRHRNKSFNQDSLSLLPQLTREKQCPAVIYADPPYTDDQYSRYYHILETLVLYDYPSTSGAGLYRPDRFCTPFSHKSKAPQAFDCFVKAAADTRADLVLSYPSNGLLHDAGINPGQILRKHYRSVRCCRRIPHSHSTFGASKGVAQSKVTELIYLAQL